MYDIAQKDQAVWRQMKLSDLDAVHVLSAEIHSSYLEDKLIFEEKIRLFPRGCFVLEAGSRIEGCSFSHPWTNGAPPPLNGLMRALPTRPETYYLHEFTIAEDQRGKHYGRILVEELAKLARFLQLSTMTLISLKSTEPYWKAGDFSVTPDPAFQAELCLAYGDVVHMTRTLVRKTED